MKKIVFSVMAVAMSMMAMATETAYVQIQLTGATGGVSNSVYLTEDNAYTSAYESGADAEKIMSQSNVNSVLMYGFVGTTPCGDIVTDNLDGVKLGLTTNQVDVNYTLKFKNFSGRELKLYDAVVDSVITINASTPDYAFTAAMGRVAVDDRFSIGEPAPVTPNICHRYGKLLVYGSKGMTVKVLNMDGTATAIADTNITKNIEVEIPLTGLADGQYKVEWNGKTLIIDVQ
jgi:hypothetical protein